MWKNRPMNRKSRDPWFLLFSTLLLYNTWSGLIGPVTTSVIVAKKENMIDKEVYKG